ncbi:hypothetical protein AAKU67_000494 [Oxalobacteraceae bacterium GrIS 2.11]
MKIKSIAAACAALCTVSAFAAPLDPTASTVTPTSYLTYYITGASAQATAVTNVVAGLNPDGTFGTSQFFATPSDVVTITQSCPSAYTPNCDKVTMRYGIAIAGGSIPANQPLLVIYNSADGSFSGMNQMANLGGSDAALADYVNGITFNSDGTVSFAAQGLFHGYVPVLGAGLVLSGSGTSYTTTEQAFNGDANTVGVPNAHFAFVKADIALADVHAFENVPGAFGPGQAGFQTAGNITSKTIGLETFGVAVNPALYSALQVAQNIAQTTPGTADLATTKIPNIRSIDYASMIAQSGKTKSAAALLSNYQTTASTDGTKITVERRIDLSGTQASSGIFFLDNPCGKGASNPSTDVNSNSKIAYVLNSQTGDVTTALKSTNTPGYAIGIVSLEKNQALTANSYNFIKLDGVSPNYSATGTYDAKGRANTSKGDYKYAVEMTANFDKTNTNVVHTTFGTNFVTGLTNSTLHDLTGVSYLDGADKSNNKQAHYDHGGASNCKPLIANQ